MELDRPHHRTTPGTSNSSSNAIANNNELFICFTSRLSSSCSMKIAKSILSPGRAARDSHISLSTSLSRRLRTNGSIKGGLASPMFPSVGKKRGAGLENPEPSSPKVTCIGQVRVKTKKKVKQTRSLSGRRSGEVSFRKVEQQSQDLFRNKSIEENSSLGGLLPKPSQLHSASSHFQQQECMPHRNQRWVHLPVTICGALRTFGTECLFPCRSSCSSDNETGKGEKGDIKNAVYRGDSEGGENDGGRSCGAVFARWFVSLHDCEGGKGREIELVVSGEEENTEVRQRIYMRSSRRHVFEDMEFKEEIIQAKADGEEEEKARLSICIPPKNALLLMRCRSDPNKMAALTNRFWESPAPANDEDEQEETGNDLKEVFVQVSKSRNEAEVNAEEGEEELQSAESNGGDPEMEKNSCLDAAELQELDMVDKEVQKDGNLTAEMLESGDQEVRKGTNLAEELPEYGAEEMEEKPGNVEEPVLSEDLGKSEEAESNLDAFEDLLGETTAESPIQWQVHLEEEEAERPPEIDTSFSNEQFTERETEESVGEGTKSDSEVALEAESEEKTEESTMEVDEEIPETSFFEETKENPTTALFTSELEWENDQKEEDYGHQETAIREVNDAITKELEENKDDGGGIMMEEKDHQHEAESTTPSNVLPECLLLMMCEPKLSMEVSKETWVCSTDFIRWLPERPAKKKGNNNVVSSEENKKEANNIESNPAPLPPPAPRQPQQRENKIQFQPHQERRRRQQVLQPPRSSCSLPPAAAAVSMAAVIEQKLGNAGGYEPLVLTRCKSEPMRTAAAKLLPEACCWNNRKLEPHRNATFGVGAAGVGF